jgi:hypothetical protein
MRAFRKTASAKVLILVRHSPDAKETDPCFPEPYLAEIDVTHRMVRNSSTNTAPPTTDRKAHLDSGRVKFTII